jgi:hypothetical protein
MAEDRSREMPSLESKDADTEDFPVSIAVGDTVSEEARRQIERIESNIRTAAQQSGSILVR